MDININTRVGLFGNISNNDVRGGLFVEWI